MYEHVTEMKVMGYGQSRMAVYTYMFFYVQKEFAVVYT